MLIAKSNFDKNLLKQKKNIRLYSKKEGGPLAVDIW